LFFCSNHLELDATIFLNVIIFGFLQERTVTYKRGYFTHDYVFVSYFEFLIIFCLEFTLILLKEDFCIFYFFRTSVDIYIKTFVIADFRQVLTNIQLLHGSVECLP